MLVKHCKVCRVTGWNELRKVYDEICCNPGTVTNRINIKNLLFIITALSVA